MEYKIAYAGCMIVNADSEKEAKDIFDEKPEEFLYDVRKIILVERCNGDMYDVDVADDIVDVIVDTING